MRRRLLKRHFERIESERIQASGDLILPLREYPVREILEIKNEELKMKNDVPSWFKVVIWRSKDERSGTIQRGV
jgi:hypothetical protein